MRLPASGPYAGVWQCRAIAAWLGSQISEGDGLSGEIHPDGFRGEVLGRPGFAAPPQQRLDLRPPASVSPALAREPHTDSADAVQALFAELTGLFEDSAELTAEGQSPDLSRDEAQRLARRLRQQLEAAAALLARLDS